MKKNRFYKINVVTATILLFTSGLVFPAGLQEKSAPPGTPMKVRLSEEIGSHRNQVGDTVRARLAEPMIAGGEVVFPAGAEVLGEVLAVQQAGRGTSNGEIKFVFDRIRTADGREYAIVANLEGASKYTKSSWKRRIVTIAIAVGAGVVLSKIFGGSVWRGVLLGGAAGTGYVLYKKGEDIILPAGTTIELVLEETVNVRYEFPEEEPEEQPVEELLDEHETEGYYSGTLDFGPAATIQLWSGVSHQGVFSGLTSDGRFTLSLEYGDFQIPLTDIKEIVFVAGVRGPAPGENVDTLYLKNGSTQMGDFLGFADGKFVLGSDYGELHIPLDDVLRIVFAK